MDAPVREAQDTGPDAVDVAASLEDGYVALMRRHAAVVTAPNQATR